MIDLTMHGRDRNVYIDICEESKHRKHVRKDIIPYKNAFLIYDQNDHKAHVINQ